MTRSEGGFTLLELMISLALFALIAAAGLALLDGVLGVEGRTAARLDRVAAVQRAMFVIGSDMDQVAAGRMSGDASGLRFERAPAGLGGPAQPVAYRLTDRDLVRVVDGRAQRVLDEVASVRWRYFDGGWFDRWPPDDARVEAWPRAVAVEMRVDGPGGGVLRRVATLPQRPVGR